MTKPVTKPLARQWTVLEALEWTQQHLAKQGEENPRLAAQMLASHATGLARIQLYAQFDKPLSEQERFLLRESIQRRLKGEPLQYIAGSVTFRYIELFVRAPVLIPRPETELLVDLVLQEIKESELTSPRILDIGTGTGAIALSLLHELPGCQLVATDIDRAAIKLAEDNAAQLQLSEDTQQRGTEVEQYDFKAAPDNSEAATNQAEAVLDHEETVPSQLALTPTVHPQKHVCFLEDDLAGSLVADPTEHHSFDVVVANPPYIPTAEYEQLPVEIIEFESRLALDGGSSGLDAFVRITRDALVLLKAGGFLAVELHEDSLEEAARYAEGLHYQNVQIHHDLTGRPRFLTARKMRHAKNARS